MSQLPVTIDQSRSETRPPTCRAKEFVTTWQNPDYQLHGTLGAGGMAQVFRATHLPSQQPVAIKLFRRGRIAREAEERQRRAESEALARLSHRNIVRLFDPSAGDGDGYLVMELVEGQNLAELVRQDGALPVEIACEVIRQTALALQHMHDRSLMHRDVKPDNLMLSDDGVVKVIDLGLALSGRPDHRDSSPCVAGTLTYMAPEQFRASDQIDARADVYGLGCTLYYLLTARHFLRCKMTPSGRRQVKRGLPLEQAAPDTPKWLVRLFNKMVAERPSHRPTSMGFVAAQLPPLDDSDSRSANIIEYEEPAFFPVPFVGANLLPSTAIAAV